MKLFQIRGLQFSPKANFVNLLPVTLDSVFGLNLSCVVPKQNGHHIIL